MARHERRWPTRRHRTRKPLAAGRHYLTLSFSSLHSVDIVDAARPSFAQPPTLVRAMYDRRCWQHAIPEHNYLYPSNGGVVAGDGQRFSPARGRGRGVDRGPGAVVVGRLDLIRLAR